MKKHTYKKTLLCSSLALLCAFTAGNTQAAQKVDDTYTKLNQCIGYYNQNKYTQALPCFTPLANAGNDQAQTYLGIMYQHGFGTPKDIATAAKWYSQAASVGDKWAYDNLKAMGNPKLATGKTWAEYKKTIEQKAAAGDAAAQTALGSLYYFGVGGIKQDYDNAKNWYAIAAVNGDAAAMNYLGRMYYYALGVEQNSMMAKQYLSAAAKAGNIQASTLLKKIK